MDQYRDLAKRALWTFVQTAMAVALVGPVLEVDAEVWRVAVLAGAASALSALKSFAAQRLEQLPPLE